MCHKLDYRKITCKVFTNGSKTEKNGSFAVYRESFQTTNRLHNFYRRTLRNPLCPQIRRRCTEENFLLVKCSQISGQALPKFYTYFHIVLKKQSIIDKQNKITFCWTTSYIRVHVSKEAGNLRKKV